MNRKIFLFLPVFLVFLNSLYANTEVFDKNIVSDVVTWNESLREPTQAENEILSYLKISDSIVIGKVLSIEPLFPPNNEMPHGLVTLEVYEGENQGEQIKFLVNNLLFICKSETPYPDCQSQDEKTGEYKHAGNLISIDADDQPWVLPGDTIIAVIRGYRIQVSQTDGPTKSLLYARFIKGEYDGDSNQDTYRQKRSSFPEIFKSDHYDRSKDYSIEDAYKLLKLTRVKEGTVVKTLSILNKALK